jgi:hypothetical protein
MTCHSHNIIGTSVGADPAEPVMDVLRNDSVGPPAELEGALRMVAARFDERILRAGIRPAPGG